MKEEKKFDVIKDLFDKYESVLKRQDEKLKNEKIYRDREEKLKNYENCVHNFKDILIQRKNLEISFENSVKDLK